MSEQHNHTHFPQLTISLNADALKSLKPGDIQRIVNEANGLPAPMPMYEVKEDPWGTRFEFSEMPEIYDIGDRTYMDVHNVSGMSMLCMRMRWGPYADGARASHMIGAPSIPFDHLAVHKGREDTIVFIVKNGNPITLHDQKELFPSDELVTKLRLLTQDDLPASPGLSMNAI